MEVKGKITVALPMESGVSRNGNTWKKKSYVLETQETYPRKVHFICFGDNADKINLQIGQTVVVSFDIDSREYNGRWYTDIRCWKAEVVEPGAPEPPAVAQSGAGVPPVVPAPPVPDNGNDEEFPF